MDANKLRKFIVLGALGALWTETLERPINEVFTEEEEDRVASIPDTDEDIVAVVAEMLRECYDDVFAEEGAQSDEVTTEYDEAASE